MKNNYSKQYCLVIASSLALVNFNSINLYASPTANEFEPCNKTATLSLEYCLKYANGSATNNCWLDSESRYKECASSVRQSHDRDYQQKRAKAEKAATKRADRFAPKPENDPAKIEFDQAPQGLQDLLNTLRAAVPEKNVSTVHAALATDFYIDRDFGGMFNPEASAKENFSYCYQLDNSQLDDEYHDIGWNALAETLSSDVLEKVGPSQICTPYGAMAHQPFPIEQLCFEHENEEWMISGYVGGGD